MRANLRVFWEDGSDPADVVVTTRDFLAWENTFGKNYLTLGDGVALRDRLWFTHRALAPDVDLDEWADTVDNVLIVAEADPVPLEIPPSTGD